jgi:hypothetical protein
MSTVVQSTCPGCKQPLRVPAGWLSQAVRCKRCGLVLQARAAAKPSGARPAVSARTPPPAVRPAAPPPAAVTAAPPVAAPIAVVAAPAPGLYAPRSPAAAGDPFAQFGGDDSAPARPSRYHRPAAGGWWKGPVIALSVLVVAAVGAYFAWPYVRDALRPPEMPGAQASNTEHPPEPKSPGTTETPKPGDTAAKPNDPRPGDTGTRPKDPPKPPPESSGRDFPNRRALVISVHNYLYANPVHAGLPTANARNIPHFLEALNKGLHVPMTEMAHLSDAARKDARAPMKPVIEKTLTDFLDTSRAQDRILVFFIGHAVAINDEAYLVPIEGELDNADTLIPLKWVYDQMARCKARQKVLVMDVNRLNPGHGLERPNGGPMDAKVDAALNAPPDGVQVWTACIAGQQSYELDDAQMGVFLDKLNAALAPLKGEKGFEGKIQRPEDPLPLDGLRDVVNSSMKDELTNYKLQQESRLAGAEPKDGAAYDKAETPAPTPALASAAPGDARLVQAVLDEVGVPPIKASREESGIRPEALPPFPADKMAPYLVGADAVTDEQKQLRDAVKKAREVMWALNTAPPPPGLKDAVAKIRLDVKADLSVLRDGFRKPGDDNKFKDDLFNQERNIADMLDACNTALEELKGAKDLRDKEPSKRWQVNYDFTLARMEAQFAYLMEYQSMLGQMRKQQPDLAPGQNGWKLASLEKPKGDSQGKNAEKASRKLLEQVIKDNAGTPWEVLAKREKLTALGLQWQGAKIE